MSHAEESLALHLKAAGLLAEREYRFHPVRRWRIDFAWPDKMLAVEVEGGVYSGGRHTRGAGFEADCIKYNTLAETGWTLFRYTPSMIKSGEALAQIERWLSDQ
jgi:very-short-patch-repair endonuclease